MSWTRRYGVLRKYPWRVNDYRDLLEPYYFWHRVDQCCYTLWKNGWHVLASTHAFCFSPLKFISQLSFVLFSFGQVSVI